MLGDRRQLSGRSRQGQDRRWRSGTGEFDRLMPKFVNTNPHAVYVDDPDDDERDLTRIYQGEEVSASGAFADNLAATSGLLDTSSDAYDEWKDGQEGKAGRRRRQVRRHARPEVLAVGPDLAAARAVRKPTRKPPQPVRQRRRAARPAAPPPRRRSRRRSSAGASVASE